MPENYSLVISDEVHALDFSDDFNEPVFFLENNKQLHLSAANDAINDAILRDLIYAIIRRPGNLLAHLQRITLCYENNKELQLSAALMDLFIVLEGAGHAIKQRMLAGVRTHLSASLFEQLQAYLNAPHLILGNAYTVLSTGRESNIALVLVHSDDADISKKYDPLQVARDFIEYSQLEEAVKVLEAALLDTPQRSELHTDLIELYQSTNDRDSFNKMQRALAKINHPMQAQWAALNTYFNQ
ncbi:MAG: hypothetical protein IBX55_15135 [Methyloprofundus sp.]|nr:hypothetical protein [Methyloprofundus sp.]MBW6452551.1 hypothetical protein [Methyloprofundus sp.]